MQMGGTVYHLNQSSPQTPSNTNLPMLRSVSQQPAQSRRSGCGGRAIQIPGARFHDIPRQFLRPLERVNFALSIPNRLWHHLFGRPEICGVVGFLCALSSMDNHESVIRITVVLRHVLEEWLDCCIRVCC